MFFFWEEHQVVDIRNGTTDMDIKHYHSLSYHHSPGNNRLDYYCYYDPYHPETQFDFDQLIPCLTVKELLYWCLGWKVWKKISKEFW